MNMSTLERYLNGEEKLIVYPSKRKNKMLVLEYLVSKFDSEKNYTEKEINEILNQFHTFGDYALLRRDLIEAGFLERNNNGSAYWKKK